MVLALVLALACGCGDDDDPADGGTTFDPPPPPTSEPGPGNGTSDDSDVALANECGKGCAVGEVCAFCFVEHKLTCVAPRLGAAGHACSSNAVCQSKRCIKIGDGGRCADECDPAAPASCMGQPYESCAPGVTQDGVEGTYCLPRLCGAQGSVCSLNACECYAGLECVENGGGFHTCEARCESDEECSEGYACSDDGVCDPLGLRPATAPCTEAEMCASNKCVTVPGGVAQACLGTCDDCGLCAGFGNGCGALTAICTPGAEDHPAFC